MNNTRLAIIVTGFVVAIFLTGYFVIYSENETLSETKRSIAMFEPTQVVVLDVESKRFFIPTPTEDGVLYIGYGYGRDSEPRSVLSFYYDISTKEIKSQNNLSNLFFTDVCSTESGSVLSSDSHESTKVSVKGDEIETTSTDLKCVSKAPVPADCVAGVELYRGLLPDSSQQLSMCYNQNSRQVTFHKIEQSGEIVNLGQGGTSPGGSGRFVVTPGVKAGTYLVHHTRSAIPESAVLINVNTGSIAPAALPDLTDVRPSRGFAAGKFGVQIHPIIDGYLVEGEEGQVFLVRDNNTTVLSDDVIASSVTVVSGGCTATLLTNEDDVVMLKRYELCQ